MDAVLRRAGESDLEHIKWGLYAAVTWDPTREIPPAEVVIEHAELARYHRDWMRPGDLGVVAERDGSVIGVAFCRLFSAEDHGHGYLDDETPEVAVAVAEGCRGGGIGTRLMEELADAARRSGSTRLSLSVDTKNPARRLYGRIGYRVISDDETGVRMVLDL
jgi:GNAT superfamily N-acetyltransferase